MFILVHDAYSVQMVSWKQQDPWSNLDQEDIYAIIVSR